MSNANNFNFNFLGVDISLSDTQVSNIKHALGLSRGKEPYRNYYNDNDNHSWNGLALKGLAKKIKVTNCAASFMYCLNENGIALVQSYPTIFNLDEKYTKMSAEKLRQKFEI